MSNIVTIGNGNGADGALKIREKETGNLDVTLTNILSANNFGSGIFVRESSAGAQWSGSGKPSRVETRSATSGRRLAGGHGIELLETGGGDLTATVSSANSAANEGFGVFGDETGAGAGAVTLSNVTYSAGQRAR